MKFIGKIIWFISKAIMHIAHIYEKSLFASSGKELGYHGGNFSFSNIYIGDNVFIGAAANYMSSNARIIIGNNVMFGPRVTVITGNHRFDVIGEYMINVKDKRKDDDKDVIFEDDVWVGAGAIILKGVTIGKGSIIGAGSVVTRSIPPYHVYVGNTQRKQYPRFEPEDFNKHEQLLQKKYE